MRLSIDNIENTAWTNPTVFEFDILDDMYYGRGYIRFIENTLSIGLYNHYGDFCMEEMIEIEEESNGVIFLEEAAILIEKNLNILLEW